MVQDPLVARVEGQEQRTLLTTNYTISRVTSHTRLILHALPNLSGSTQLSRLQERLKILRNSGVVMVLEGLPCGRDLLSPSITKCIAYRYIYAIATIDAMPDKFWI